MASPAEQFAKLDLDDITVSNIKRLRSSSSFHIIPSPPVHPPTQLPTQPTVKPSNHPNHQGSKLGTSGMPAYARSKLFQIMWSFELQRRLRLAGRDVDCFAVHPGACARLTTPSRRAVLCCGTAAGAFNSSQSTNLSVRYYPPVSSQRSGRHRPGQQDRPHPVPGQPPHLAGDGGRRPVARPGRAVQPLRRHRTAAKGARRHLHRPAGLWSAVRMAF